MVADCEVGSPRIVLAVLSAGSGKDTDPSHDRAVDHGWVDGVVREYDDREGFGVIDSPVTPKGVGSTFR